MKYLVYCQCGHNLELHGSEGCSGERKVDCGCRYDQLGALNAAIDNARTEAAVAWRRPEDAAEIA